VSIETAFLEQSRICATLGSLFMSRLMRMIGQNCAHHEACLTLFADWEKDAGITSGVLPLRLGAALHALVFEKINYGLVEVYPPNSASDHALWNGVLVAFQQHEQFIRAWLKSPHKPTKCTVPRRYWRG
jgi:hypothetical protein